MSSRPCEDHKGIRYPSKAAMLAAYGISYQTFSKRLRKGMPLREALETPVMRDRRKPCKDQNGTEYPSKAAMAAAHDILPQTFSIRIQRGMSLREALDTPASRKPGKPCRDHEGTEHPSQAAMAAAYGILPQTLDSRLRRGMSLREALVTPVAYKGKKPCDDHAGTAYPSKGAMLEAYGISRQTFSNREKKGMPLKKILETPTVREKKPPARKTRRPRPKKPAPDGQHGGYRPARQCEDHLGNAFPSVTEMCRHWGVKQPTFRARLKAGYGLQAALTAPPKTNPYGVRCMDHKGNVYASINEMCRAYGIDRHVLKNRLSAGMPLEEALETPVAGKE